MIWQKRDKKLKNKLNIIKEVLDIKNSMNRKRVSFHQPLDHKICITPYWLLGFVEGEGFFV